VIRVAAHAKVNLYLHVVGRRADGYHLLDSLVVFADLHDEIAAEAADDLTLAIDGPFAGALADESDNLMLRAARALAEAHGRAPQARLRLTKRIPVSAGIGGGSADAAATLRALAELWSVAIPDDLPLRLGADVPACLADHTLFIAGIGEELFAAPRLPPGYLLLVNPGRALATRDVFGARSGDVSLADPFIEAPADVADFARVLGERSNDLTAAATRLAPEIGLVQEAVAATDGCRLARMSGSGATVFGLYASREEAMRGAATVARAHPTWWTWSGGIRDGAATLTRSTD
jgi:4-diphosphocytidyl-2-C-methyl-D-erythritol kinase